MKGECASRERGGRKRVYVRVLRRRFGAPARATEARGADAQEVLGKLCGEGWGSAGARFKAAPRAHKRREGRAGGFGQGSRRSGVERTEAASWLS